MHLLDRLSEMRKDYEEMMDVNNEMIETNQNLKRKIEQLKASEQALRLTKKARRGVQLPPAQRQMLAEVAQEMKNRVVRVIKFPTSEWDAWSVNPNTACGQIVPKLSWPPDTAEDYKKEVWKDFIAPSMCRILTQTKNRITNARSTYYGEDFIAILLILKCTNRHVLCKCLLLQ